MHLMHLMNQEAAGLLGMVQIETRRVFACIRSMEHLEEKGNFQDSGFF